MWLYFIHYPLKQRHHHLTQTIHQLEITQKQKETIKNDILLLERTIAKKKKKYNQRTVSLQKNCTRHDPLRVIFDSAGKANLIIQSHIPHEMYDGEWYRCSSSLTEFHGTFDAMLNFLDLLSTIPLCLNLSTITLEKVNSTLQLKCMVTIFQTK